MAWAPDYITSAELKAYLRISHTDDDVEIALAVTAASRAVDLCCSLGRVARQFGVVSAQERFYTPEWDRRRRRWVIEIDDLMSTAGSDFQLQDVDGNDVGAIDSYILEPRNAAVKDRPWTRLVVKPDSTYTPTGIEYEAALTAPWGWTAVPSPVKQATKIQGSRFFARRNSPYGIAGSPDDGSEMRLLSRVDPDVSVSLGSYKRWGAAA
jgi:uncharacterized phiE125 gp8 family phage protein